VGRREDLKIRQHQVRASFTEIEYQRRRASRGSALPGKESHRAAEGAQNHERIYIPEFGYGKPCGLGNAGSK